MAARKRTAAERSAKTKVCRALNWTRDGGYPSDREVIEKIAKDTGWPRPSKQMRRIYMLRYVSAMWRGTEIGKAADAALTEVATIPAPVQPKSRQRFPARKYSRGFYDSDEWRQLRYRVLKKFGSICQCCGANPKDGRKVHVDHIKPRSKYPELELEFSNLQVLCEDCNLGKLHLDETDWRPVEAETLPEGASDHLRSLN